MKPFVVRTFLLLAAGSALVVACIEDDSYVYSAQKYDAANACVGDYHAIEIIDGNGAKSTCPKACFEVNGELYVSTVCPPLPAIATSVASNTPDCKAALAAPSCSAPSDGGDDADGDEDGGDSGGEPDAERDAGQDSAPIVDASDAG